MSTPVYCVIAVSERRHSYDYRTVCAFLEREHAVALRELLNNRVRAIREGYPKEDDPVRGTKGWLETWVKVAEASLRRLDPGFPGVANWPTYTVEEALQVYHHIDQYKEELGL